jgi:tetratricopeptide (TPR) repeat protein
VIRLVATIVAFALGAAAHEHLERGLRYYDTQRYEEAIREFRDGYALEPDPQFLYALGQAERKRGNCTAAVELYRTYLRSAPTDRQARVAEEQIARCTSAEPVVAAPAAPPPALAPPSPPPRRRLWTWIGLGVTGAVLASAAAVEIAASSRYDELSRTCAAPLGTGCSNAAIDGLSHEIDAATGLFVAAGALGAATLVAIILESRHRR